MDTSLMRNLLPGAHRRRGGVLASTLRSYAVGSLGRAHHLASGSNENACNSGLHARFDAVPARQTTPGLLANCVTPKPLRHPGKIRDDSCLLLTASSLPRVQDCRYTLLPTIRHSPRSLANESRSVCPPVATAPDLRRSVHITVTNASNPDEVFATESALMYNPRSATRQPGRLALGLITSQITA